VIIPSDTCHRHAFPSSCDRVIQRILLRRGAPSRCCALVRQGCHLSFPGCLLMAYMCTCTHSPHPPPWPSHSLPDCSLMMYRYTLTHSPHSPPRPGPSFRDSYLIAYRCIRTHSPHPPPWLETGSHGYPIAQRQRERLALILAEGYSIRTQRCLCVNDRQRGPGDAAQHRRVARLGPGTACQIMPTTSSKSI